MFRRRSATPTTDGDPSLTHPVSQPCTAAQFDEPVYARWCAAIGEPPRTLGVGRLRGEVMFSAITAHSERGPRFDGISVVIPAGQRVALMDRSGAEASALLSYLLRFDQPETGRVLLDRYDTRSLSLTDLRGALAVVQREPRAVAAGAAGLFALFLTPKLIRGLRRRCKQKRARAKVPATVASPEPPPAPPPAGY